MPTSRTEESVFYAAIEIDGEAQRREFIERECGSNHLLYDQVMGLIRGYEVAGALEVAPPVQELMKGVCLALEEILTEVPGTLIGRYKLLQQIGEGGFGVVFLAEQQEPVVRLVALKVIKLGMDTRQVVARFEAERQALALMDHPNIAKVLDGGATETGRPYFVMELVKGVPITQYCDANKLSIDDRLGLFMPVCKAIQHAHQKGIIHRDLKPSNVMVTLHDGAPVPKVIDFGVSKAINQRLTERTLFTEYAQMIGTPAYMSPEQAEMSGLDVDTRSDIYSLGVLLYQLLTGTTPHDAKQMASVAYGEIQRIIREVDPPKPSTRSTEIRRSSPVHRQSNFPKGTIAKELDWIVMKALEKDRRRRYENASDMTQDIERFIANEPVEAGAPDWKYRAGRFMRRHRTSALAAAVILFAMIVATVISFIKVRAERNLALKSKTDAEREAVISKTVNQFINEDILAGSDPYRLSKERDITLRQVLDRASLSFEERFGDHPEAKVEIQKTLAGTYEGLEAFDEAIEYYEAAVKTSTEIYGRKSPKTLNVLKDLSEVYFAKEGYQAEGLIYAQEALAGLREALGDEHVDTLEASNAVAIAKEPKEGEVLLRENLAVMSRVAGEDHEETIETEMMLAWMLFSQGTPEKVGEALSVTEMTLKKLERVYGVEHRWTLTGASLKSTILVQQGKQEEARLFQSEILARSRKVLGDTDLVTQVFLIQYMETLVLCERFEEAIPLMEELLAHPASLSEAQVDPVFRADTKFALGGAYYKTGRKEEAMKTFEELMKTDASALPEDLLSTSYYLLAEEYTEKKQYDKALPLRRKIYEEYANQGGPDSVEAINSAHWLGDALSRVGELEEAEAKFRDVIRRVEPYQTEEIFREILPWALYHLGGVLLRQERKEEATVCYQRVLDFNPEGEEPELLAKLDELKKEIRERWMPEAAEGDE